MVQEGISEIVQNIPKKDLLPSKEQTQLVIDSLPSPVCYLNGEAGIVLSNEEFKRSFLEKDNYADHLLDTDKKLFGKLLTVLTPEKPTGSIDLLIANTQERRTFQRVSIKALSFNEIRQPSIFSLSHSNIDDVRALRKHALVDKITRLYNQNFFEETINNLNKNLKAEQKVSERRNTTSAIGIIMGDVNGLKPINDTYGHKEGDRLLRHIAQALRKSFRPTDFVSHLSSNVESQSSSEIVSHISRSGGDEFGVILSIPNSELEANPQLLESIEQRVQSNIEKLNQMYLKKYSKRGMVYQPISIALGSAYFDPLIDSTYEDTRHRADQEMYQHKAAYKANQADNQ